MKILIAEDEKPLAKALTTVLEHNGYEVTAAYNGAEAQKYALDASYDCYVFDIMMPVKDGITALTELRGWGDTTPAIFLTAKSETSDKIMGLDAGADDYLTKPYAMNELLARIRSLTRRSQSYKSKDISYGNVVLDTDQLELKGMNSIRLASKESQLMEMLMRNPGKSFTTEEIFTHIWKDEPQLGPDVVWLYISYLRNKLISINANLEITGDEGSSFALVKASAN